jgi:hypothetical protein
MFCDKIVLQFFYSAKHKENKIVLNYKILRDMWWEKPVQILQCSTVGQGGTGSILSFCEVV